LDGSSSVASLAIPRRVPDLGISGIKDKRPELDRLMADAHRRKFDVVIVWKFDRFARSVPHCSWPWRHSTLSASGSLA